LGGSKGEKEKLEFMDGISKIIASINKFITEVVSTCILALLTMLVVYEVILRYFFGAPTFWSMEVTQYMFCAITMLTGGYCQLRDGNVRVDLFYPKMSPKIQALVEIITYPLTIFLCVILIWLGGDEFWRVLSSMTRSDSIAALPLWPVWLMIPLGGLLLLLQVVARYIKNIQIIMQKN
jgi:TRAP-type mannitol/chloroaromatic compound transport system permease small subunit